MKAVIGVDNQGAHLPAIQLFSALRFPKPEVTLLHAVNTVAPYTPFGLEPGLAIQAEYGKVVHNLGLAALDKAKDAACARNLRTKGQLVPGRPSEALVETGDRLNADLIAVATHPRSRWSPSFVGSVARSLAIASRQSLLIAKGVVPEGRRLRVVLATDHSDYAGRWIDQFIALRPEGIAEIHVLTAYNVGDEEAALLKGNVMGGEASVDPWIEARLLERNQALADRLAAAGYAAKTHVVKGETNDAIRRTMQDVQADLLVLGAQGHGFLERVLIGSVALHQAMIEPYPVLIIRLPASA